MIQPLLALRILAQQSLSLRRLRLFLWGIDAKDRIVQRGLTRICIEGYPRSANTLAVQLFQIANDVSIGHHTHSTANIARALLYGIPTIVVVRNPVDAITSLVIGSTWGGIDYGVWYYLKFYRWVESKVDSIVIAGFEMVINDFNCVIRQVNKKYDTAFDCIENLDTTVEQAVQNTRSSHTNPEEYERRLRWIPKKALPEVLAPPWDRKDARLKRMAAPDGKREEIKAEIRPLVLRHKHIDEAQTLYARLIELGSYE